MFRFKTIYFVVFTLILYKSQAEISDKRLCIDKNCSEVIAIGKTLIKYYSPEKHVLSFGVNEDVKVYSYGAGTRSDLVGVEIKGKRGYINTIHLRETNRYKTPKLLVDTEIVRSAPGVSIEHAAAEIKADPTQQPFEIVDGTRIPLDVDSFSTEAPVVNVGDQSSEETTKPLDSVPVPDIQDLKAAVPEQVEVTNTEQNKIIEGLPQQQQPSSDNDDEDSDDDGDGDSDDADAEDDEVDEENPVEDNNTNAETNDSPSDAVKTDVPSEKPDIVASNTLASHNKDDANVNVPNDDLKRNEAIVKESMNSEFPNEGINVKNTTEEAINAGITAPDNVVPNKKHEDITFEKASIAVESTENLKIEAAQTSPTVADGNKINLEGSVPLEKLVHSINENNTDPENATPNEQYDVKTSPAEAGGDKTNLEEPIPLEKLVNSVKSPEVNEFDRKAFVESNNEHLKVDVENSDTDNAENNKKESDMLANMLYQTKEPTSSEEPPLSSTQDTLELEIPPLKLDVVTPNLNSANSQDIDDLDKGNSNNDTEAGLLPDDSMPEFKDPEKGADIQIEAKPAGGLFGGLGAILPMFNTGGDRAVGELPSPNQENGDPEESVDAKQPADFSFSDDVKPVDSSEQLNPDQLLHNNEPAAWDNISDITTDQNDVAQNLNADATSAQIGAEETESPSIELSLEREEGGILSNLMSFFVGKKTEEVVKSDGGQDEAGGSHSSAASDIFKPETQELNEIEDLDSNAHNPWSSNIPPKENENNKEFCDKESCQKDREVEDHQEKMSKSLGLGAEDLQILFVEAFSSDLFLYLTTTALSVMFMIFGMVILDKCRREGPLIARINNLEQRLMTTIKENELLQEKSASFVEEQTQLVVETVPNEMVEQLTEKLAHMHEIKLALEDQIAALERELDTSTEVGTELNKIISEMLNSSEGSDIIKENIEQMQKKLFEQQDTINAVNETLSLKETENHELRLEMVINNGKVTDLQSELDRLVEKIVKIEDERDQQHSVLENEILAYQTKCKEALSKEEVLNSEIQMLKQQLTKFQRISEVKVKEYNTLKESLNEIKAAKNNKDVLKSLLEVSEIKAQLEQFKSENMKYSEQLTQGREANLAYGSKVENLTKEVSELREKYAKADKEKVEVNTKLQVLNNYFKEKEDQMQKEISKYESLWAVKEGEATSTTERIRHMQDELQNYKSQNESLKQEIVNQEVELKSQISMLEKKSHESWVANRQTERKLEEARQEAAQLRNRLTLRERAIAEGNNQNRMQSPLHQNGELPMSPLPLDPTQSPPPLFNPRDHLAKSPPIPGMPPFLPPPLGATPFIPPPPLDGMMPPLGELGGMPPHFMPPLPPGMYPGDHRPPPLGRMSSPPPVGGRYSPESTVYSDYDRYSRRSPSPPYDSEYGASPPPIRGYSPYQDRLRDDRREYKRPQARSNGRNSKGIHSSGSENDSLGKINKKSQRKV